MNMQHNWGDWEGKVSLKGRLKMEKEADERASLQRCMEAAGKRVADKRPADSAWIVLQTKTGREIAVETSLVENGIDACAPVCRGPKRRRRHKELPPESKPVFMGYVFVRCVPSMAAMVAIRRFEYVDGVVGGWLHPFRVDAKNVSHFKEMATSGAYDWEAPGSAFRNGSKVVVKEGPFYGFEGVVVAFGGAGKGTPVVELEIFGRTTPMLIPIAMLGGV